MGKYKMSKNIKWEDLSKNKLLFNKKYIIVLSIFLLGIITLYINISYGLFKKRDILTDINFVTGTLEYKIENDSLENNSIFVSSGSEYKLVLNLTSLNTIDSKYELYYLIDGEKVTNSDIEIGYTSESVDSVKGTIGAKDTKEITVSIKNNSNKSVTITFGCEGGLIDNTLVMSKGNSLDQLIMSADLVVAYTYVGQETAPVRFPNKGEGYFIKSVTCNGSDAEWNNVTWSLTFSNVTGKNITCNFEISDNYATTYVMYLAETNTNELRIDTHEATGQQNFATTEYRYYGVTPNNYVEFNGEMWRIIGVFDVDNGSGTVEKRLKIIRNQPIGEYSWDSSESSVNKGTGVNEWSQADLMALLNSGAYYNRTTGNCYTGASNATTSCDFSTIGLAADAKTMIGHAKWYLGAHTTYAITSADMYKYERSTASSKQCTTNTSCNDTVERKTYWIGEVALMYASDYGYASDMESCSSVNIGSYNNSCYKSNWLYSGSYQWLINTNAGNVANNIFRINNGGNMSTNSAYGKNTSRPVVYLNSDIKITTGNGTEQQPYILSK